MDKASAVRWGRAVRAMAWALAMTAVWPVGCGHAADPAFVPEPEDASPPPRPALSERLPGSDPSVRIVRATDRRVQPLGGFARVAYARTQAFNADDTAMLVLAEDETFHLLGVEDLRHRRALPELGGVDGEPQWHPTDPRRLRYFPRDRRSAIAELDVETGISRVLVDLGAGRLPWRDVVRVTTRWEGSPSMDGRYWCLMAYGDRDRFMGVFTYDLQLDTVLGHQSMARRPDHVSMSPSGRHCVVSHEREDGGTRVWDRTLGRSSRLHAASEHSDLARGSDGRDYYVIVDYDTDGELVAIDLDSLSRTRLLATYLDGSTTAYHVSARNFDRPGWVVVSTYAEKGPRQSLHGRVLAVELKADPRVVELARHRSRFTTYWTAPVATTNRDLTRVAFNSNWGTGSEADMDVYIIEVPAALLQPRTR